MEKKPVKRSNSQAVRLYLIAYNGLLTIGWSVVFLKFILFYLNPGPTSLYDSVKCTLIIAQNAAVLEILHAAVGIVSSNVILTAFQVASRVMVVCGILIATHSPRSSIGLPLLLFAWSVTEIIRYSSYFLNLINNVPYFLKYLRYTTFIALYPIGITGELLAIYASSKEVGEGHLYSIRMPNSLNVIFNYQYFLWLVMLMYIPLFPQLYLHMFAQRRKFLGSPGKQKAN